jgi:hypothetical protein
MIVEPAPTNPRSPLRRAFLVAGMVAPLVLLVGVVAAGALGPQRAPVLTPDPSALAQASADAASRASAAPELAVPARPAVAFPAVVLGLPVEDVATALATRAAAPSADAGLVAVAGYLSYGGVPFTCIDAYLDPPDADCAGRTTLTSQPVAVSGAGAGFGGVGPHLHPQFPPGTRAPAPDDSPGSGRSQPMPVILVGSFDDPRSTCTQRCDEAFVVSRVAWVAGDEWDVTLTIDPAMAVDPNIPEIRKTIADATRRLGDAALILQTAVVRPDVLARIDAGAAAALPDIAPRMRLRPVTYVRGLVEGADGGRAIDWVVLDSVTGRLLARGGATS